VFDLNRQVHKKRQRLYYCDSIEPLADDDTLGGLGVAQDGSAKLVLLLRELSADEAAALGQQVYELSYIFSEDSNHCKWALNECVFLSPSIYTYVYAILLIHTVSGRRRTWPR
jgi:hypothetical protein